MGRPEVIRLVIAVMLVTLFLVSCESTTPAPVSEAPAATATPVPSADTPAPEAEAPAATPTLTPIPPTPSDSAAGIGDTLTVETWKVTVTDINQETSVESPFHRFSPDQGFIIQVVKLEIENTADVTGTLELDLDELAITDVSGRPYISVGAGMGDDVDIVYTEGLRHSGSIGSQLPDNKWVYFNTIMDGEYKYLGIEMSGESIAKVTFAFPTPVDAADLELQLPDFPPIQLDE